MKTVCFLILIITSSSSFALNLNALEIIEKFSQKLDGIKDYQCRMYVWSKNNKTIEKRYINFYFKKPRNIRMDIIKGSKFADTGSIGVFLGSGKVTGRKGGLLSGIALTVDKNSKLATTIRGVTFDESDVIAALKRLEYLKENSEILVIEYDAYWLLDCKVINKNSEITRDQIAISKEFYLPIFTVSFINEEIVQRVEWGSYILNQNLPFELFNVWYDTKKLNKMNIKNNLLLPLESQE